MKKTTKSLSGTSFNNVTISASVNQLIKAIGEPTIQDNTGDDKTNFEWEMELKDKSVFSIYDWKEYRKLDLNETIEWHIGSHGALVALEAKEELEKLLN